MVYRLELERDGKTQKEFVMRTPCDWKEAIIRMDEQHWLSVAVGNTHCFWAMGTGVEDGFVPTVFWTSTPVTEASINTEDPLEALSNHVPHQIHLVLFGDAASRGDIDPLSAANANLQSSLRKVPDLTIYVQSTNNENERGILFLFSKLAHRMYGLTSQDFFSKEDGCYDTLGVDRAASVYCAYHCFNTPVLVLDGGTALTYTACDGKGKLMGGGISLGFLSRFRALADYCGKLPLIDFEEYEEAVAKIQNGGAETLPVFAMDTNTAMMTSVFQEISLHCHTVILHFLDELKKREAEAEKSNLAPARSETKALPKVVMAGSDSRFLETLLEKPGLVVRNAFAPSIKDQVDFRVFRNGCHYAVGKLLEINRDQMDQLTGDDELRARLVGQRVAKEFPVADADGDIIYRGSVRQVKRGELLEADFFTVQFDDGDNEDLDFEEIYAAMKLYINVGEKDTADPAVHSEQWKEDRKKSAEKSTTDLFGKVVQLQEQGRKAGEEVENTDEQQVASETAPESPLTNTLTMENTDEQQEASEMAPDSPLTNTLTIKRQAPFEPTASHDHPGLATTELQKPKKPRLSFQQDFHGIPIAKYFEIEDDDGEIINTLFTGTVVFFDGQSVLWKVKYDDGDEEEFDEVDLRKGALLYLEKRGHKLAQQELQKLVEKFSEKKGDPTRAASG